MQYIFGYGSLIYSHSRNRTTPGKEKVYPITIKGLARGWWALVPSIGPSTTFLGCVESEKLNIHENDCFVNGVVYEVTDSELALTDRRESGYRRVKVDFFDIFDYCGKLTKNDTVWIYLNEGDQDFPLNQYPSNEFPIVQSYVDLCINGCIEIESNFPEAKGFIEDFIKTTLHWNEKWVNDRLYPRRPFIYEPNASFIDRLLKQHLTDTNLLSNRTIE